MPPFHLFVPDRSTSSSLDRSDSLVDSETYKRTDWMNTAAHHNELAHAHRLTRTISG
jgi:hypothetical protein